MKTLTAIVCVVLATCSVTYKGKYGDYSFKPKAVEIENVEITK